MKLFEIEKISEHVDRIKTPFGVCVYYVHGNEKGLLIDTGMGIGNLKKFIEETYKIPYDVALTHGHCDHAGGASQFDTVYLNKLDWDLEKEHATLEHREYDVFHSPFGIPEGIELNDFVPQRSEEYIDLNEDVIFDLKDVCVKWIFVPGHTQGCMIPIIEKDRIAIIGDAIGENTLLHFPESTSIKQYQQSLIHFKEYSNTFDICLRFHGSGKSDKKIIDDMISLCSEVMNHQDAAIVSEMMGYKGCFAREKDHPGFEGNFIYNPDKII